MKILSCTTLYILLGSVLLVAQSPDSSQARLNIHASGQNLLVFMDDAMIGRTPLKDHPITAGRHEFRVRSPQWPSLQVEDYIITRTIAAGETLNVEPVFPTLYRINSIPYHAQLLIDGERAGQTPLLLPAQSDSARLRFEKEGYEPWEIRFSSWRNSPQTVTLRPQAVWLAQQQQEALRANRKNTWHRWGLYGSLLLGMASGAATIHLRDQGNDAYSAYLGTADPAKMERHFSRARRYDRAAGASYAVFEVSFVLSGYFFLKSRQ